MTSRLFTYLFTLLVLIPLAALPLQAQSYDDTLVLDAPFRDDIKTLPLSTALDLVLQAQLNNADARYVLAKAAHSGNASHIPVLKQIANAYAEVVSAYSYQALYAALQLGEPTSYFINLGIQSAGTWFSYDALRVAAMRPDSAHYQQILPLKGITKSGSGLNAYETVLQLKALYGQMPLAEEIDRSLANLQSTFRLPSTRGPADRPVGPVFAAGDLEPTTVWAREHLAEIALTHPTEVTAAINAFVQLKAGQFPAALQASYQQHLMDYAFPANPSPPPGPPACPATLAITDFRTYPPTTLFIDLLNTSSTDAANLTGCTLAFFNKLTGKAYRIFQPDTTLAPGDTLRLGPAAPYDPKDPPSGAPEYGPTTIALVDLDTLSVGTDTSAVPPGAYVTTLDYQSESGPYAFYVHAFYHSDAAIEPRYCTDYAARLYPGSPAEAACSGSGNEGQ